MTATPPMPDPMPPGPSLFRRAREGLRSSLALFQAGAFLMGGVGRHRIPRLPWLRPANMYTVREPELIHEVLITRARDFPKSRLMRSMLGDLIGDSIFVANGETWRWRRAIVGPALEQARVKDVFERMLAAAKACLARIEAGPQGQPLAIDGEMTHFAADVIFRTLFSEPIPPTEASRIIDAFETFQGHAYSQGMLRQTGLSLKLMPGARAKRRAALEIREALAAPLHRRLSAIASGADHATNDIAASLIAGADPSSGRRFSDEDLLDEVAMLFLAGHETSASSLAWTLYLLAIAPDIQERARSEAMTVFGRRDPEFGDVRRLTLIRNIFRESLRLYPPVAIISRDSVQPEHMADRDISPGAVVCVTPWIMHRQSRFWANPHAFDPDRFDTDMGRSALHQAYLPFSQGPRVCPGAAFALQEACLILGMLLRSFRFDPVPSQTPQPAARLTLRSANGVRLLVTPVAG